MADDEAYFADLIRQGYSVQDAIEHTRTYFPDFNIGTPEKPQSNSQPSVESIAAAVAQILDKESSGDLQSIDVSREKKADSDESKMSAILSYGEAIFHLLYERLSEKRVMISAATIVGIILLSTIALSIPKTMDPIIGTWEKADGQEFTFLEDSSYLDEMEGDSTWTLNGSNLVISTSTVWKNSDGSNSNVLITQELRIQISDDSLALWMKWDSIIVNSDSEEVPDDCVLLLKKTALDSDTSFVQLSNQYSDDKPTWC
ncbi:MAG: hypothetical protein CMB31_05605 [Euryarchaeota archaeon]|nr:hypothetical protein [Euryarchaeota archaeon]|tara:strand:- start:2936 stop:3709 length:774 start_codon:yes stop_codon:yes gene_type:complete